MSSPVKFYYEQDYGKYKRRACIPTHSNHKFRIPTHKYVYEPLWQAGFSQF